MTLERIESERPIFYCVRCRNRQPQTPAERASRASSEHEAYYNRRTKTYRCVVCAGPSRVLEPERVPGGRQLSIYDQLA